MAAVTRLSVVFFDSSGTEVNRVPLTELASSGVLGVLDYILGDFVWADDETVRVLHANRRDYWNISSRGDAAFVFSPAESGNPQGLYQLATWYAEGRYVRENRQHAIELMRQSAVLGHKHAQNFLKRDKKAGQG